MQKLLLKTLGLFSLAVFFSSCMAFHDGYMTNSASLGAANFSYVEQNVKGVETVRYFMMFGGVKNETLVNNAKQNLIASHPLKKNQALANITVNFKYSYSLFTRSVKCTVTADIVEFK